MRKGSGKTFDESYMPEPNCGCWIWLGSLFLSGYASFQFGGKNVRAHKFSYEKERGPVPHGMVLDHICRMKCCVNPDHLECVTQKINMRRHFSKHHKYKTHCPKGHPYSGENLYVNPKGQRVCRECVRGSVRRYQQRNR